MKNIIWHKSSFMDQLRWACLQEESLQSLIQIYLRAKSFSSYNWKRIGTWTCLTQKIFLSMNGLIVMVCISIKLYYAFYWILQIFYCVNLNCSNKYPKPYICRTAAINYLKSTKLIMNFKSKRTEFIVVFMSIATVV